MRETIYVEAIQGKASPTPVYQFKVYRYKIDGSEEVIYRSGFSYVSETTTLDDGAKWCKANGYLNVERIK